MSFSGSNFCSLQEAQYAGTSTKVLKEHKQCPLHSSLPKFTSDDFVKQIHPV